MKKKITMALLATITACFMFGCGNNAANKDNTNQEPQSSQTEENKEEVEEETSSNTENAELTLEKRYDYDESIEMVLENAILIDADFLKLVSNTDAEIKYGTPDDYLTEGVNAIDYEVGDFLIRLYIKGSESQNNKYYVLLKEDPSDYVTLYPTLCEYAIENNVGVVTSEQLRNAFEEKNETLQVKRNEDGNKPSYSELVENLGDPGLLYQIESDGRMQIMWVCPEENRYVVISFSLDGRSGDTKRDMPIE